VQQQRHAGRKRGGLNPASFAALSLHPQALAQGSARYFIALLTLLKVSPMLVPSALAPPMMATAISAAIRPYSMAVAPV
jgi:hypothetical protein